MDVPREHCSQIYKTCSSTTSAKRSFLKKKKKKTLPHTRWLPAHMSVTKIINARLAIGGLQLCLIVINLNKASRILNPLPINLHRVLQPRLRISSASRNSCLSSKFSVAELCMLRFEPERCLYYLLWAVRLSVLSDFTFLFRGYSYS